MGHDLRNRIIEATEELIKQVEMLKDAGCIDYYDATYPAFLENLKFALELLKPTGEIL